MCASPVRILGDTARVSAEPSRSLLPGADTNTTRPLVGYPRVALGATASVPLGPRWHGERDGGNPVPRTGRGHGRRDRPMGNKQYGGTGRPRSDEESQTQTEPGSHRRTTRPDRNKQAPHPHQPDGTMALAPVHMRKLNSGCPSAARDISPRRQLAPRPCPPQPPSPPPSPPPNNPRLHRPAHVFRSESRRSRPLLAYCCISGPCARQPSPCPPRTLCGGEREPRAPCPDPLWASVR